MFIKAIKFRYLQLPFICFSNLLITTLSLVASMSSTFGINSWLNRTSILTFPLPNVMPALLFILHPSFSVRESKKNNFVIKKIWLWGKKLAKEKVSSSLISQAGKQRPK